MIKLANIGTDVMGVQDVIVFRARKSSIDDCFLRGAINGAWCLVPQSKKRWTGFEWVHIGSNGFKSKGTNVKM